MVSFPFLSSSVIGNFSSVHEYVLQWLMMSEWLLGGIIVNAIDRGYQMSGRLFLFVGWNWDLFISLWGWAPQNGVQKEIVHIYLRWASRKSRLMEQRIPGFVSSASIVQAFVWDSRGKQIASHMLNLAKSQEICPSLQEKYAYWHVVGTNTKMIFSPLRRVPKVTIEVYCSDSWDGFFIAGDPNGKLSSPLVLPM